MMANKHTEETQENNAETDSSPRRRRPRGRAPKGRKWNAETGTWVTEKIIELTEAEPRVLPAEPVLVAALDDDDSDNEQNVEQKDSSLDAMVDCGVRRESTVTCVTVRWTACCTSA